MNYIFVDTNPEAFYPLALTRPVSEIRAGILTIREKVEKRLKAGTFSYITSQYLQKKYPGNVSNDNVLIDAAVVADKKFCQRLSNLMHNQALVKNNRCLAIRVEAEVVKNMPGKFQLAELINSKTAVIQYDDDILVLEKITDLFSKNDQLIRDDFEFLSRKGKSHWVDDSNKVRGKDLFVRKDARVSCSVINTETGPVYIDKGAEVMEGCMLRGPLYIGKGAVIKMGAKIYGPTTIGPECRVGGEVSNSVMQGYSNKGHDGFMGNSVLGEWCNLGADTNTSNLKNNYGQVRIWDYSTESYRNSGLQFCGLLMGDHSKSAINTQFNTGTTVGVMANIFTARFPDKYIPSFSWLGDDKNEKFDIERGLNIAKEVMHRRHVELTDLDRDILRHLAES